MLTRLIGAIGVTAVTIGAYFYGKYRADKETEEYVFNALDEELAEYENMPLFNIGDNVIICDPNIVEPTADDIRRAVIENIAYISNFDGYAYKINGSASWYNEAWLSIDEYGPATYVVNREIDHKKENEKETDANVEYWLRSYSYEKERGNDEGMTEALTELRKLKQLDA